jgi:hypothetical protein
MFRNVSKKRKPSGHIRTRTVVDDEEEDNEQPYKDNNDESLVHHRIQETLKKQKILAALPLASSSAAVGDRHDSKQPPFQKKLRFLSTSSTTLASQQHLSEDDKMNMTVLAQKHRKAMEEYIQGNMQGENETKVDVKDDDTTIDPEAKLYQELAAATVPSKILGATDDDRGTMLVGGIGLAEVILPKHKRFNDSKPRKDGVRYSRNPHLSSAVAGSHQYSATSSSDTNLPTAGFRSMVPTGSHADGEPDDPSLPNPPATEDGGGTNTRVVVDGVVVPTVEELPKLESDAVDDNRPGFASLKPGSHKSTTSAQAPKTQKRGQQYQKDHQTFTKFVKRERDRR